ncbi:MAG: LytTR family transcriptional regulator [Bacteroidales bacterium]|nr:LytTR family transcriptional regulator [Bacteroidales bacterium]
MSQVSKIFRRFIPQLLHMIVLPVFFFLFMIIYRPFNSFSYLGNDWFGVHLTILSCILLVSVLLARVLYYFLPLKLNYTLYLFWCLLEIIFTSFFVALYVWLALHRTDNYFDVFAVSFQYLSFVLVFPYVILALSLRIYDYHNRTDDAGSAANQRMRFYDEKHNLKIVLTPEAILYITAEENYVNIFYLENSKVRNYVLRSSMKALDELCQDNGLIRCHRSYYVNPSHVKVLRKEKEGVVYAELDAKDVMHIPVTKRYYDRLSEML